MGHNLRGSSSILILKNTFFISLEIPIALLMPTYRQSEKGTLGDYTFEECEEAVTTNTKMLPRPSSCATAKAVHPPGDER